MPWRSLLNLLLCSCKSIKPEWRQPPLLRQLRAQCQLFDQLRTAFCFLAPARFASTSSSTCSWRKGRWQLKPLTAVQIIHNKSAKAACCGAVHQRICLALPWLWCCHLCRVSLFMIITGLWLMCHTSNVDTC